MTSTFSVAVVGGGIGGIAAATMLKRDGYENVTVFEKNPGLGGVWHANTYPGAACDVPSHFYEFSFAMNPDWSRRYAPQPEIKAYLERVVREQGVEPMFRFNSEVRSAIWDDRGHWVLDTATGEHVADVLITACGQLSTPKYPDIEGLDEFEGPAFHTATWRHDVDLTGKRVAVIGTGCSAAQVVPAIQPQVATADVYQRSPGWTMPRMDYEYSERAKRLFRRFPALQRLDRRSVQAFMEFGAIGMTRRKWLLTPLKALGRKRIRDAIADPALQEALTPKDEFGCKRVMVTDAWYPVLAKPNVQVITGGVQRITPHGVVGGDGVERQADVLVLATGFKSHDFVAPMEIRGVGGRRLADEWAETPKAYLGLSVPAFPNMFLLYGPNTNGGTGSVVFIVEAGMTHVLAALAELKRTGTRKIEVRRQVADDFHNEVRQALPDTVWSGCGNWYLDENGHSPNQWPWRWAAYTRRTRELEPGAYLVGDNC
ncbi:cation diffusion facilitator CzcD-associated flavoprotein CzcO [Mycobacterium sp. OAS707]|uniref:flavin-containing monooxygenase n=1 Tax=Mycobacterium sp. OAS707 TaxID=2663822 RepID=UPI001789D25B|nr:NAD(P)/FAD-dependent oxidoreductase [Mycobacterium sp. OAS707]MBE1551225.1 cation diffusion facilitator CzcD-associated flavoprotein CzcO [Mycobacterium sp. OAS707]